MIDLPFKARFDELPEIDPVQLAEYFNLEFGVSPDNPKESPFIATDFSYIGVHQVNNIETMFWSVKGRDICATVQPYEDSYMIAMDQLPSDSSAS